MPTISLYPDDRAAHGTAQQVPAHELNRLAARDNCESWIRVTEIPGGEYEGAKAVPEGVPLLVPLSQAYYWTREWQQGEREADKNLEEGNYVEFSGEDPNEVRRWLEE